MKTLKFEGYSDDTMMEHGITNQSYDNCATDSPIHCIISAGNERIVITGYYNINPTGGVWMMGVSQYDEDSPIPNWPIKFKTKPSIGYSPILEIDVPDEFSLEWWDGHQMVTGA